MAKGELIVLCGVDGSGKTTLMEKLKKNLKNNQKFVYTREPGGTPKAELIRDRLLGEEGKNLGDRQRLGLFFEARAIHLQEKIRPAIRQGQTVISDRFDCCTFVYQRVNDTSLEPIFWAMRDTLVDPTSLKIRYVYLETSAEIAIAREQSSSTHNHFDQVKLEEVEKRIRDYNSFFEKCWADVVRINTDHISEHEVFVKFLRILL